LTSLEDIQNSVIGSKEWLKFGSKVNDPFLSIFNEGIKSEISKIEYEPGKSYNFTDGEFEYKIDVEQIDEVPKYTFFIRPKKAITIPSKIKNKSNKSNNYLLIGPIVFVLVEFLILLMLGVFQALFR
jgi:hypothetical protein